MSPRASASSVGVLALVVLAGHLSLAPKVADLDAFYHVGHAAAYAEGSLLDTSLPWATQSIVADYGADLWWGFHALLVPFTAFDDVADGIRVAAAILTLVLAATVLWIFRRHRVVGPAWWTALFLVAVPNVFYRYLMARPHVLSVAAALLLASLLVRGRWWQVALATAGLTWVHLSLFWVAPLILAIYVVVRLFQMVGNPDTEGSASVPLLPAAGAVVAGTVAGWLLRPEPLATALLANVQLVRLFLVKSTEAPLLFSVELSPLGAVDLVRTAWLFLAVWAAACAWAVVAAAKGRLRALPPEERALIGVTLLTSSAFLALTLLSARRALVEWTAFGFVGLPLLGSTIPVAALSGARRRAAGAVALALLVGHLGWGVHRHLLNVRRVAFPGDALAEAAGWLEANSDPDDIVFHGSWDDFGPLFAHNRTNRYLGGMDPIFQFAHDPRLYWEHFWLSADIHDAWTCDAFPCNDGAATDTYEVIRDHFGARWVLTEPARNPRLSLYLLNDPRYALALETQHEAVFEVLGRLGDPVPTGDSIR